MRTYLREKTFTRCVNFDLFSRARNFWCAKATKTPPIDRFEASPGFVEKQTSKQIKTNHGGSKLEVIIMSLKTILIAYLIGGLTLPPLAIALALYLAWRLAPEYTEAGDDVDLSDIDSKVDPSLSLTAIEDEASTGVKAYKAGWITVTREYHTVVNNASDKQIDSKDNSSKSAYTALYKLVKKSKNDKDEDQPPAQSASSTTTNSSTPVAKKSVMKKNRFFGVLRHGNLFLYKNEDQKDVQHVIVLANNIVTIWPRGLPDGQLFTKRSAICILKPTLRRQSDLPPKSSAASLDEAAMESNKSSTIDILENGSLPNKKTGFFIYCDTNFQKEDWYFELIKATKKDSQAPALPSELDQYNPSIYANTLHFKTADMMSLIQTLHSSEGQLHTRWLNAIIGRLHLALKDTDVFEKYVEAKLLKKLSKINRPDFLDEFQVKKIEIGDSAPFISFPKLQSLNPDGSLRVSCKFTYTGKMSLQIATKANIPNFSTFQKRDLNILLAVTINRIDGPFVICMKPPPSSRLWYTFESQPDIDLTIEPVVSQRQLTYGLVTNAIEKKFKDAIRESLVEPFWDDISIFNTSDEFYRGGIWNQEGRPTKTTPENDNDGGDDEDVESMRGDSEQEVLTSVTEANFNTNNALSKDYSPNEDHSLRSRSSQNFSKRSTLNTIHDLKSRKSEASIGTSHEQFLADGSYVSKSVTSQESLDSEVQEKSKTTMQVLSAETSAGKKVISNGMKKIGKWYSEKSRGSSSNVSKNSKDYTPPEMISRRRAPSSGDNQPSRKTSLTDIKSAGQTDVHHKVAPQAHAFPAQYMYGLETQTPDTDSDQTRRSLPSRIPEMSMPHSVDISSPVSPSRPRRKPVSADTAIEMLATEKDAGNFTRAATEKLDKTTLSNVAVAVTGVTAQDETTSFSSLDVASLPEEAPPYSAPTVNVPALPPREHDSGNTPVPPPSLPPRDEVITSSPIAPQLPPRNTPPVPVEVEQESTLLNATSTIVPIGSDSEKETDNLKANTTIDS